MVISDIIVLISFLILFVSISFLINIGKEMSLPEFRSTLQDVFVIVKRRFVRLYKQIIHEL